VSLVTVAALAIAFFVALPVIAHRLRRMRADEKTFAAARLVPPALPRARRRARLEDRALFSVRAFAILLLAALGASPFVRCTRLSMQRSGGASVALAIVVDDSMSMRAPAGGGSRFDRAKAAAQELLAGTREGDAVAIVLAGAPCRVVLAATTDLRAAKATIDALVESDRKTDLDGALELSRGLLSQLPQVDKRVVVLSDLADASPDAPPLGQGSSLSVWAPLEEIRGVVQDCGILAADRSGDRVKVRGACGTGTVGQSLDVSIMSGETVVSHTTASSGATFDVTLTIPKDAPADVVAKLGTKDAIASDDVAPVLINAGPASIAVIAETSDESVATGGAPVLEQALTALRVELAVRPLPALPDRDDDLAPFAAIVLDDPAGLTPEQRRVLEHFFARGGVVLFALGPRAAQAPLGATFEPALTHNTVWEPSTVPGVDPASAKAGFDESAQSLLDLSAPSRTRLSEQDVKTFTTVLAWKDGAPLFARRTIARGEVWTSTLPFSIGASDLVLRPGFLALLDAFCERAKENASARRSDVGVAWTFPGVADATAQGPAGVITATHERGAPSIVPPLVGAYSIDLSGQKELHVAAPIAREMDTRPRTVAATAQGNELGDTHAQVDASPVLAVLLLLLLTAELVLRVLGSRVDPVPDARA
jgi:von Willebrand factor type A domain/Aerotolerance regulator N-terminal